MVDDGINTSNNNNNNPEGEDREINLYAVFFKYMVYWPWFVASVLACCIGMYVFLRYQTPVYNVTSSVLIKEDEKKGANAASGLAAIQDLGMLSMTSNFDNEVEILRSRTLIKKVVNDMGLYIDMEESNALGFRRRGGRGAAVGGGVGGGGEARGGPDGRIGQRDLHDVVGGEHAGDELGVAPVVLAARVSRRPLHLGDGGHGAVEAERAQLARHVEAGGAALVAGPGPLEPEGPLRDLGGVRPEVTVHHLAGEGVERRGGDRSRVDVQADGGNMGHGKPPPRRCGKGYRTGRYSKPIVASRARGKKLRRGGGNPNGFLISSYLALIRNGFFAEV